MAALVLVVCLVALNTWVMKTSTAAPILETMVCIYEGCVVTGHYSDLENHVVAAHGINAANRRKVRKRTTNMNSMGLVMP